MKKAPNPIQEMVLFRLSERHYCFCGDFSHPAYRRAPCRWSTSTDACNCYCPRICAVPDMASTISASFCLNFYPLLWVNASLSVLSVSVTLTKLSFLATKSCSELNHFWKDWKSKPTSTTYVSWRHALFSDISAGCERQARATPVP